MNTINYLSADCDTCCFILGTCSSHVGTLCIDSGMVPPSLACFLLFSLFNLFQVTSKYFITNFRKSVKQSINLKDKDNNYCMWVRIYIISLGKPFSTACST